MKKLVLISALLPLFSTHAFADCTEVVRSKVEKSLGAEKESNIVINNAQMTLNPGDEKLYYQKEIWLDKSARRDVSVYEVNSTAISAIAKLKRAVLVYPDTCEIVNIIEVGFEQ